MGARTEDGIRARADELHHAGMPFQMAMAVARGRLDLSEALERMARRDRVERLMREHGLTQALATQIVVGHADLAQVLFRRGLAAYRGANETRSILTEDVPLSLGLHGPRIGSGRVQLLDAYEFQLTPESGPPEVIHKLQVKYAYRAADWKKAKKAVRPPKKPFHVEPVRRPQDRYNCSDRRLYLYMDRGVEAVASLLEGETIRGRVTWFSRFEFGLQFRGEVEVVVFRHALTRIRDA